MGYQFYELLLLFSIYSIMGWIIGICSSALTKGIVENRGICRGPYCPSYGIGALLMLFAMQYLTMYHVVLMAFLAGLAVGTILEIVVMGGVNGLCGGRLISFHWYHPLLFGAGGIILVCHLNPLLTAIIRSISPWIHFAFLILFWIYFTSQFIEGISKLMAFKKRSTISSGTE